MGICVSGLHVWQDNAVAGVSMEPIDVIEELAVCDVDGVVEGVVDGVAEVMGVGR